MKRKATAKIMAALVSCAVLASCGSQPPAASDQPSAGQNAAAGASAAGSINEQLAAYNDVMTLRGYYNYPVTVNPDNYTHEWILKQFKIDLQPTYVAGENFNDKVRTLAASNQLPDFLMSNDHAVFDELSVGGQLLPMDNLLKGPNATQWYPSALRDLFRAADGNLYILNGNNIPFDDPELRSIYFYGIYWGQVFTVNQDILKQTGMQTPKTIDDMVAYLQAAVKLTGPDGQKVTGFALYGFGPADYSNVGYPTGGNSNIIMHMLEQRPDSYAMEPDDQNQVMKFSYEFTAYPKFLKLMSKMYREGLLDKEMFVETVDQMDAKMKTGSVAMSAFSNNIEANNSALTQKSNLPYAPIDIPRDPSVQNLNMTTISPVGNWFFVVNKNVADPERLAKYIEWNYGDEALMISNYGPPDPTKQRNTWWYEDGVAPAGLKLPGKPALDLALQQKWDNEKPGWALTECGSWGANALGLRVCMNYERPGEFGVCMASDFTQEMDQVNGHDKNVYYVPDLKMVKFEAAPYGDILKAKGTVVKDLLNKWEVKIIMQAKDDAEVDSMYAQMMAEANNAGYPEIAKEAYQIYKKVNQ